VECRSGDEAGGERREEVRGVRKHSGGGRWGVWIERVVERGWRESGVRAELEVAVVGRVEAGDALAVVSRRLDCAVQKVEVERVESADMVWAWPLGACGVAVGSGVSSLSNSEEAMLRGCRSSGGQEAELNGVAV
jgi:hypothetical protein